MNGDKNKVINVRRKKEENRDQVKRMKGRRKKRESIYQNIQKDREGGEFV